MAVDIQALRRRLKVSQERFAVALGVAQPTFARWEKYPESVPPLPRKVVALLAKKRLTLEDLK